MKAAEPRHGVALDKDGAPLSYDARTNSWAPRVVVAELPWGLLFLVIAIAVFIGVLGALLAWSHIVVQSIQQSLGGPA